MRSFRAKFLDHWFDVKVEGIPLKAWCSPVKNCNGKVYCKNCGITLKFDNIGLRALRDHALTRRHKENRDAAVSNESPSPPIQEPCEASEATSILLQTDLGQWTVDLAPLQIDTGSLGVKTKEENQAANHLTTDLDVPVSVGLKSRYVDVFMCFYCAEEFSSRTSLQAHQMECDMKPPELQAVTPPGRAVQPVQEAGPSSPPLPPLLCDMESYSEVFSGTPVKSQQLSQQSSYIRPSKHCFTSSLGLIPKKRAAQVSQRRRNTECESIDLDDDIPVSPSIQRTPKRLLSHLSRENSNTESTLSSPVRRRYSILYTQQNHSEKDGISEEKGDKENGQDGAGEEKRQKMTITKSLYNLDLTSPLGQFVIKHIKGDPNLHVLADVESHCLTAFPKKNPSALRLRERHAHYPITFRGYAGKTFSIHHHQYNFSKRQRREFMLRVSTGLDKRSRALLRAMKKCHVRLQYITKADLKQWIPSQNQITVDLKPLTASEIAYWTSPKPTPTCTDFSASVFPNGLTFSSPNVKHVLGLRTKPDPSLSNANSLSVSSLVSEEVLAELIENKRTVYQSLLSDSASSESSSSETENSPLHSSPSMSLLRQMLTSTPNWVPRRVNDITNLKVDLPGLTSTYGVLSPVSTPPECLEQPSLAKLVRDKTVTAPMPDTLRKSLSVSSAKPSQKSILSKSSPKKSPYSTPVKCSVPKEPLSISVRNSNSHKVKIHMSSDGQSIKKSMVSPLTKALSSAKRVSVSSSTNSGNSDSTDVNKSSSSQDLSVHVKRSGVKRSLKAVIDSVSPPKKRQRPDLFDQLVSSLSQCVVDSSKVSDSQKDISGNSKTNGKTSVAGIEKAANGLRQVMRRFSRESLNAVTTNRNGNGQVGKNSPIVLVEPSSVHGKKNELSVKKNESNVNKRSGHLTKNASAAGLVKRESAKRGRPSSAGLIKRESVDSKRSSAEGPTKRKDTSVKSHQSEFLPRIGNVRDHQTLRLTSSQSCPDLKSKPVQQSTKEKVFESCPAGRQKKPLTAPNAGPTVSSSTTSDPVVKKPSHSRVTRSNSVKVTASSMCRKDRHNSKQAKSKRIALLQTMSVIQQAEERKSLMSSFL